MTRVKYNITIRLTRTLSSKHTGYQWNNNVCIVDIKAIYLGTVNVLRNYNLALEEDIVWPYIPVTQYICDSMKSHRTYIRQSLFPSKESWHIKHFLD